jgi:hypothetical protein
MRAPGSHFEILLTIPDCIIRAAVTSAALDSRRNAGSE